jgi:hypothetical protein
MTVRPSTPETRWSLVATAGRRDAEGQRARDTLCNGYRFPVFAHLRRSGHGPEQAAALCEDFFTRLKARLGSGGQALPDRFRHFLFEQLEHYLASAPSIEAETVDGDWEECERRLQNEPLPADNPELAFRRNFAEELTERAFQRLRIEAGSGGHEDLFEALTPYLTHKPGSGEYETLSQQTGLSGSSLAMALRRLRRRLRELVTEEVGQTLDNPESIAEEQASLAEALSAKEEWS